MEKLKQYLIDKPHLVISIPAVLSAVQFIMSVLGVIRTGVIDGNAMNHLVAAADGFETVILFVVMLVLKNKK